MINLNEAKAAFQGTEEWLSKEYSQVHTGQASPAILDSINVEVYGAIQPIKNIGSISIENSKTLLVAPWDKSQIKDIEKAIIDSGLGLSTAAGDSGVRVILPQLTEETRGKLAKVLKAKMEDARVSIRKERQTAIESLETQKKDGDIGEDDIKRGKEDIQKMVDASNIKLEEIYKAKEVEIMSV
ncbi:MAG: ribosome recycling factor [Candidatus Paceibacteria bacterium]|jgi:ribosome recycling factor